VVLRPAAKPCYVLLLRRGVRHAAAPCCALMRRRGVRPAAAPSCCALLLRDGGVPPAAGRGVRPAAAPGVGPAAAPCCCSVVCALLLRLAAVGRKCSTTRSYQRPPGRPEML
jgi:hypothetical protein